ncbi:hypothetical protein ABD91_25995 [Lysinibacillus sphaericus]|uniref:DUF4176 domain-containing protein n=1 Tax=Lysinibacillus sphaericus TaxID=1421 RepID=UPI0018CFBB30|nr:DUF4176 domain-containing protein [Lysinibacillus sphaericus]MBG9694185.1 hypothetical protein [Lysinibacillus sphaericus]
MEVFHPIGTVVEANIQDKEIPCLIIGHRMINPFSMKAWDYVAVAYPEGLVRHFTKTNTFDYDDFLYFNHPDIIDKSEEEKSDE